MLVHLAFDEFRYRRSKRCVFPGRIRLRNCPSDACDLGMICRKTQQPEQDLWTVAAATRIRRRCFRLFVYDPALADPAGPIKRSRKVEANGATTWVAMAAYETAWSYAGKPTVIVAPKRQAIPFDVDIEPVLLEEDGRDVSALGGDDRDLRRAAWYARDCLSEKRRRSAVATVKIRR
jgi:hypothetical protein